MTLFEMQEAVARGDDCPRCGGAWVDSPEDGKGARTLQHAAGCELLRLEALDERSAFDKANPYQS